MAAPIQLDRTEGVLRGLPADWGCAGDLGAGQGEGLPPLIAPTRLQTRVRQSILFRSIAPRSGNISRQWKAGQDDCRTENGRVGENRHGPDRLCASFDARSGNGAPRAEGERYGETPLDAEWNEIRLMLRHDVEVPVGATAIRAGRRRVVPAKRAKEKVAA